VAEDATQALRGAALATRFRRLRVVHAIRAWFEQPVTGAELVVRLAPRSLPHQRIVHHQLVVDPRPTQRRLRDDPDIASEEFVMKDSFRTLEISAVSTVERADEGARLAPASRDAVLATLERAGVGRLEAASFRGPGACRAGAEAALALLRGAGVEARYVAGYAIPARGARSLPHAWVSILVPGHGFIDFDPTAGVVAPDHVVLGSGAGYDEVAPFSGSLFGSGGYRLSSEVTVESLLTG
jgi:hypothetical protein